MAENRPHEYRVHLSWTGNLGTGTSDYRAYSRAHEITAAGRPVLPGSSDPAFRGDPSRYNPEELLVASLSACHMLWYLHLCAEAGIVVTGYVDAAGGTMVETPDGGGAFAEVVLRPVVTIRAGGDAELAETLHERAHELCFIARSVNFPVRCEPRVGTEAPVSA
jgi:organic hydroperoxide reductase OsmC/OhrA